MTSSVFPDVNVWLALSAPDHVHFPTAWRWYQSLDQGEMLYFCRMTQLGLLRLLTTRSLMGPGTLNQTEAWKAFDSWLEDANAEFLEEPAGLETAFRFRTGGSQASPKEWGDAYLAAFAEAAGLTLVTFDRALAGKVKGAVPLS
jgi:toxin-antitoxin system PIN domain toxin